MDAARTDRPGPSSRRVSFFSKCQVIPPQCEFTDDAVDDYFGRQAAAANHASKHTKKSGLLHLPFRSSKKSRRWSSASTNELTGQQEKPFRSRPATQARPDSVPIHASSLQSHSPSLPISRDGTANRLRQKLVSPPPPEPETPLSPPSATRELQLGSAGRAASDTPPLALLSSPTIDSPVSTPVSSPLSPPQPQFVNSPPKSETPQTSLARPVAVRKPLTFGFGDDDKDDVRASASMPKLSVPPIIYSARTPKRSMSSTPPSKGSVPEVLNWRGASEDDSGGSFSDSDEDEGGEIDEDSDEAITFEEEDLHGECTCVDCEDKMIAALAPSYAPHWTRGARRKYLADRKETLQEESRKAVRPPIWLRSEESEAAATSKLRDICADEADAAQGIVRKESVAKSAIDDGQLASTLGSTADALKDVDAELRKEVDEEVHLREEEHRLKKTRCEMRRLSSDFGSGLRMGSGVIGGGGGARAMMRQLEEAEQAERRAKVERSRSPRIEVDGQESARPMGAVAAQDVPNKTYTPPPRIPSPLVVGGGTGNGMQEKPARAPSPLKRALSASMASRSKSGEGETTKPNINGNGNAGKQKNGKDSPPDRHPSPSLLIRRELTLGIPVQSNTAARSRSSWQQAPGASTFASPDAAGSQPSPASGKLADIAEAPSSSNSSTRRTSGRGTPAISMVRSNSFDVATTLSGASSAISDGSARSHPHIRRANTAVQSAGRTADKSAHRLSLQVPTSSGAPRAPPGHLAVVATPAHFVEARIDKAKARARSSFKDLVARIKN